MSDWTPGHTTPHPESSWREWGDRTLRRMRENGFEHAPWNHLQIWFWAASTDAGRAWLEREIEYWHGRMNERARDIYKTRRRKPLLEPGALVEYVDDEEAMLPFTEQLHRREKRDWMDSRFVP